MDPVTLAVLATVAVLLVALLVIWLKGRPFAEGEVFRARATDCCRPR
jgi:hypothetical protein